MLKRILKSYRLEVNKSLTCGTCSAKLVRAIFTCNFEMTDRPTARQSWINSNKNVSQCTCRAVGAQGAGGVIANPPDFGRLFCPIWADYAHHITNCPPPAPPPPDFQTFYGPDMHAWKLDGDEKKIPPTVIRFTQFTTKKGEASLDLFFLF